MLWVINTGSETGRGGRGFWASAATLTTALSLWSALMQCVTPFRGSPPYLSAVAHSSTELPGGWWSHCLMWWLQSAIELWHLCCQKPGKCSLHQAQLHPAYTHLTLHTSLSLSLAPKFDSEAALAAGSLCSGGILLPKHTFNERTSCSPLGPTFHSPL